MVNNAPQATFFFPFKLQAVKTAYRKLQIPRPNGKAFLLRSKTLLQSKPKWKDREYRQNYMQAALEQTISWQIKLNREARGMSQEDLAAATGLPLATIQENEDTTFEDHDFKILFKIANAFDCAISAKLIPYSELAYESNHLGKNNLYAAHYDD